MGEIRRLPDNLINKIAAGEVVERPASVAKELVENALDAGAATVNVTLEEGGRRRVMVEDDGRGMDREDALLALERHATSKLAGEEELERIRFLGFRGEALPSIASVSRLLLRTRTEAAAAGVQLRVEGGELLDIRDLGYPRGTTVEVADLFYNMPARQKFLRAPSTELSHVTAVITRTALATPVGRSGWTMAAAGRSSGPRSPACASASIRSTARRRSPACWRWTSGGAVVACGLPACWPRWIPPP